MMKSTDPRAMERQGMVRIYESEAYDFCIELLQNWKPRSEVFFLTYGVTALPLLSCVPGLMVASKIRALHRLHRVKANRVANGFVICALSSMSSFLTSFHIHRDVILQKTQCPVCLEIRGMCLQAVSGIIFPSVLSTAAVSSYLLGTSRLKMSPFSLDFAKWMWNMLYQSRFILITNACVQSAVVSLVLLQWVKEWNFVLHEMNRDEDEK